MHFTWLGMDSLQIKKMIVMEAATYTTLGLLAGCGLGLGRQSFLCLLIYIFYYIFLLFLRIYFIPSSIFLHQFRFNANLYEIVLSFS